MKAGSLSFDEESKQKCRGKKALAVATEQNPVRFFVIKQIEHAERIDKAYIVADTSSREIIQHPWNLLVCYIW